MTGNKFKGAGFTLIEMIIVIVILGILAATALPKFISLSRDAKIAAITQIKVAAETANEFMFLKSQMPSYSTQPVANRADLIDVDTNDDGNFDTRLKWYHLDNTDIEKRVYLSDDFVIQYQGITTTYIGYDSNENGQSSDDNCYFKYTQASSATTPPVYELISNGC